MTLTPDQKKAVSSWIAAGASIAEVQKRLRDEFQVSLTYIDTRLLIDDLGLNLKAPPPPAAPPGDAAATAGKPQTTAGHGGLDNHAGAATPAEAELLDDGEAGEFAEEPFDEAIPAAGAGNVKVEVDRLVRPGMVISGSVTFSDGKSGKWALDQIGRLVFEGSTPGYRPSQADLQTFQRELSAQLQRHGY